jgi:hypothetical protein
MLKKVTIIIALIFTTSLVGISQICTSGALFASGAGCGCLSGCDLTPLGGLNCGGGTSGNCSGGHMLLSTTIIVPVGCQVQITAEMKNRTGGCSASGADGNSTSGDRLRVRNSAGPTPPWQIGSSNSSLFDQLTVTGPATIFVEGAANRSDEIITYTVTNTGTCSCSTILPISLTSFSGKKIDNNKILIEWSTASEINNDYFTIEHSINANDFNSIGTVFGAGNSNTQLFYQLIDDNPTIETNYYRLKQTDFNGNYAYSNIIAINNNFENYNIVHSNQNLLISALKNKKSSINIYDIAGRIVYSNELNKFKKISTSNFQSGIYIIKIGNNDDFIVKKMKF